MSPHIYKLLIRKRLEALREAAGYAGKVGDSQRLGANPAGPSRPTAERKPRELV